MYGYASRRESEMIGAPGMRNVRAGETPAITPYRREYEVEAKGVRRNSV
jgi:hypothetical protein